MRIFGENMKEMKVVGRQKPPKINLDTMRGLQELVSRLREGKPYIPKGVHRFKSFEEADEWTLRMMTRKSQGSQE